MRFFCDLEKVVDELPRAVSIGSVFLLQNVAIFSPQLSVQYLNITISNVLMTILPDVEHPIPKARLGVSVLKLHSNIQPTQPEVMPLSRISFFRFLRHEEIPSQMHLPSLPFTLSQPKRKRDERENVEFQVQLQKNQALAFNSRSSSFAKNNPPLSEVTKSKNYSNQVTLSLDKTNVTAEVRASTIPDPIEDEEFDWDAVAKMDVIEPEIFEAPRFVNVFKGDFNHNASILPRVEPPKVQEQNPTNATVLVSAPSKKFNSAQFTLAKNNVVQPLIHLPSQSNPDPLAPSKKPGLLDFARSKFSTSNFNPRQFSQIQPLAKSNNDDENDFE